ncbi:metallophosphoesterase family protein [Ammoniphilus resinae]|uniref:DNA repair exonuclease SbcCD nuclease subunit n=1 Tax=Ammoniphilus resinae TaxID=861532 RepID=A0ABS4GM90_9BACL|nr:DNA repair exonuclease [Ammoniphilus resinae]MBP1931366.1 DNA repair exonuclease SbcCD nuclease subunit [Ammoniphilus resinae]
MKFIHAADIHLDSPLRGLERYEGAPVETIRGASRQAFVRLVDLCLEEEVDFLLIAGDLYDGNWPDFNTGLFFAKQMSRLREASIPVYLIRGNHDAASRITKQIPLPENVHVFSFESAQTYFIEPLKVAIHGQSFAMQSVTENLVYQYPMPCEGYFNIGLLHTSLNGREGHESYAPCTVGDLIDKGYDYWALGHIHKRELISENPWILFPGNIQGRHIKETGDKGCSLIRVEEELSIEHRSLDVLRWDLCEVDITDASELSEVYDQVNQAVRERIQAAEQRLLALRIVLTGSTPVHQDLNEDIEQTVNSIRAIATDSSLGHLWVEKIKIQTKPVENLDDLLEGNTPLAHLLTYIESLREQDVLLEELVEELKPLRAKLPPEFFEEENEEIKDTGFIKNQLKDIEQLIISQILK